MKYKVEITETLQKTIEIETKDETEAILKIKDLYNKEEIILDDSSYIDTEFNILED